MFFISFGKMTTKQNSSITSRCTKLDKAFFCIKILLFSTEFHCLTLFTNTHNINTNDNHNVFFVFIVLMVMALDLPIY